MKSTRLSTRAPRLLLAASLLTGGSTVLMAAPAYALDATLTINMVTVPADPIMEFLVLTTIDESESGGNIADQNPAVDANSLFEVAPGGSTVTVTQAEVPGWVTDITCEVQAPEQFQVAAVPVAGPFTVNPGDTLDCTITNTRGALLGVGKRIIGDPGDDTFNVTVDGLPVLVGSDGTGPGETGTVPAGTSTIAETPGPDTNLGDYSSVISCQDVSDPEFPTVAGPVAGPAETNSLDVTVAVGDDVACLVDNFLEPSIQVVKQVVGDSGDDSFDLTVNGDPVLTGAVDGSASEPVPVGVTLVDGQQPFFGATIAESAGPGTNLAEYISDIVCAVGDEVVVESLDRPAESNSVDLFLAPGSGQDVVCTITNTLETAPDLTIAVEGEDPTFEIDGPAAFLETREIDPGESVTLADVPPGEYVITITDPDDVVVEAVDCDPEEVSVDLAGRSVTVLVGDIDVSCLFTIAHEDDGYDQYPGDDDFDFETPFENADDDDDPAPTAVAGEVLDNGGAQNGGGDPQAAIAGDPGALDPAPAGDVAPQTLTDLPRTGAGFAPAGLLTGLLMIAAGVAALLGGRRRSSQA